MSTINVVDLTDTNGQGVFDKLAVAMRAQLETEFSAGRITGVEYAKVYSSGLDTVIGQSIQFLLQKDISAAQADLLKAQTVLAVTQELAIQKEILLTEAQTSKVIRETELLDQQELLLISQTALTDAQVLNTQAQTAQTQMETDKLEVEIEVLEVQKTKLAAEVSLANAQFAQATKQTEVLAAQLLNIPKEGQLLDKQVLKAQSETDFLLQRIKTEKAQIIDTVDGVAVTGVLGKQKLLYQAQTDGFTRDAEQKLAKMVLDTWSVRRSTDEGTVADNVNKLSDANIGAIISKCMTGVGVIPV